MEPFAEIVDCIELWTIFVEHFTLGVSQGYEFASNKTKRTLVRCHLFHKKLGLLYTCLSFQTDSLMQLNTCDIN